MVITITAQILDFMLEILPLRKRATDGNGQP
jgi:hypothetical protein